MHANDAAQQLDMAELDRLVLSYFDAKTDEALGAAELAGEACAAGRIEDALALFSPEDLAAIQEQQPRLHFRLRRQVFVELLRQRTPDCLDQAISFLREELAPLALHAYPEAYCDLKACLPALLACEPLPPGDASSGACDAWLQAERIELAGQLGRLHCQLHGCREAPLTLALSYLSLSHAAAWRDACGGQGPAAALLACPAFAKAQRAAVDALGCSLEGRPPPLESLHTRAAPLLPKPPNRLVTALRTALGLRREEAVEAIRAAGGDISAALRAELAAVRVSTAALDGLAREYAASRGLELPEYAPGLECADTGTGRDATASAASCNGSRAPAARDPSRSPPKKAARRLHTAPGTAVAHAAARLRLRASLAATAAADRAAVQRLRAAQAADQADPARLAALRAGLEAGEVAQVAARVQQLYPAFLPAHPAVDFELHAALFHCHLKAGATAAALALARQKLAALSEAQEQLRPRLKAVLACLIPGTAASPELPLPALADLLVGRLRAWLGLQEPRLVSLLQTLLQAHERWLEVQRCEDPLEAMLGIDRLRAQPPPPQQQAEQPEAAAARDAPAGPPLQPGLDEELIAEAMDATALSRTTVISLLADVGGSLEALLNHLFQ